jgi:hypothetical protein
MGKAALRLLCVLPLITLAACSSDDDSGGTGGPHDTQAPTVESVTPPDSSTDMGLLAAITVTFSEAMNAATLNAQTVTLDPGNVALELHPSPSAETLVIQADSLLPASQSLTLAITGAEDLVGNPIVPFTATMTTGPLDCAHLADRFEPNEEAAAATQILVDTLYTGLATCLDDVDLFRFSVGDTFMVTARTHIVYANEDAWQIYWVRQDGVTSSATLGTTAHTGWTQSFHYTFLPGTYCVRIYGAYPEERIIYDLELETGPPCRDDVFEDNDFEDEAAPITPGVHEGLTGCYLDSDWYSFSVLSGETITFTMDTREHTGLRRLIIREPGGTHVNLDSEELDVPVSTANLVATADGTARVKCMVWEDGITYDMTIAVD